MSAETIAAALDSGARGILVPRVSSAAQAAAAVEAARYPPLGRRGVGPGRAASYGYRIPEYLAGANAELVVALQVETAEGLDNVDAIAATEGVDVVFVGGDLSVSIDAIGPEHTDRLSRAIEAIVASPWRTARSRASSAPRPRRWADGRLRAPASLSWPATPCSSARKPRRGTPPHARWQYPQDRALAQPDDFLSLKLSP